jgi:hypothetical protein
VKSRSELQEVAPPSSRTNGRVAPHHRAAISGLRISLQGYDPPRSPFAKISSSIHGKGLLFLPGYICGSGNFV